MRRPQCTLCSPRTRRSANLHRSPAHGAAYEFHTTRANLCIYRAAYSSRAGADEVATSSCSACRRHSLRPIHIAERIAPVSTLPPHR